MHVFSIVKDHIDYSGQLLVKLSQLGKNLNFIFLTLLISILLVFVFMNALP